MSAFGRESPNGTYVHFWPKLLLAALRRNVGKSRKSGANANFDYSGRACPLCPDISDFNLFRYRQRVVHLNAKISDGTFDLGMAKQKLYGPQVAGSPVDQRCLVLRSECVPNNFGSRPMLATHSDKRRAYWRVVIGCPLSLRPENRNSLGFLFAATAQT